MLFIDDPMPFCDRFAGWVANPLARAVYEASLLEASAITKILEP
jgi:hypothetical protein